MALDNFKRNHLMPLHFKGLNDVTAAYCAKNWFTPTDNSSLVDVHHF